MSEERYQTAGWIAIIAGALFPFAFVFDLMTSAANVTGFESIPVGIGFGDFMFLAYAVFSIYILKKFKHLLFEYYSFKKLNTVIEALIWMYVLFFGGSFIIELLLFPAFSSNDIGPPLLLLSFWGISIFIFGILDLILAIMILKDANIFSTPIKVFASLTLVMGLCEISVIFSFLSICLVPIIYVAWAFVFFKEKHEVEFV